MNLIDKLFSVPQDPLDSFFGLLRFSKLGRLCSLHIFYSFSLHSCDLCPSHHFVCSSTWYRNWSRSGCTIEQCQVRHWCTSSGCIQHGMDSYCTWWTQGWMTCQVLRSFTKKILKMLILSNLSVSSYKATEMDDRSNFFNAIGQWSSASLQLQAWMRTHFVDTVFVLIKTQAMAIPHPNDPTKTIDEECVVQVNSLFKIWNTTVLDKVFKLCEIYYKYSESPVEAQNLNLCGNSSCATSTMICQLRVEPILEQ